MSPESIGERQEKVGASIGQQEAGSSPVEEPNLADDPVAQVVMDIFAQFSGIPLNSTPPQRIFGVNVSA